jgi:hypothetical protein
VTTNEAQKFLVETLADALRDDTITVVSLTGEGDHYRNPDRVIQAQIVAAFEALGYHNIANQVRKA